MVETTVHKALSEQSRLLARGRRCSISEQIAQRLNLTEQDHVRVMSGETGAYYVVDEIRENGPSFRTGKKGRTRLGLRPGETIRLAQQVPFRSSTAARRKGGLAETVWDDGQHESILVYAPHGGDVEFGTDDAAMRLHRYLTATGFDVSLWALHGFNPPHRADTDDSPSAFSQWHIKKPFRTTGNYPGLDRVADRRYDMVVSMHMQNESYTAVGGQADRELRERIADELADRIRDRYDFTADTDEMQWAGVAQDNTVNGLARRGGIQIEMQPIVAYKYRKKIAEGTATVLNEWLEAEG